MMAESIKLPLFEKKHDHYIQQTIKASSKNQFEQINLAKLQHTDSSNSFTRQEQKSKKNKSILQ